MWRLWHRLFGWDYVGIEWGHSFVVCRVLKMPNGIRGVVLGGSFMLVKKAGVPNGLFPPRPVIPLTFSWPSEAADNPSPEGSAE